MSQAGNPRDLVRAATSASFEPRVRKAFGYSFVSMQDIRTMQDKLNANTAWKWSLHVNDTYGEYLLSRPFQGSDYARVRIFSLPAHRYHLDVRCVGGAAADGAWQVFDKQITDGVLQQIGASDITEAGYFD